MCEWIGLDVSMPEKLPPALAAMKKLLFLLNGATLSAKIPRENRL
jgi:hypothetical protein